MYKQNIRWRIQIASHSTQLKFRAKTIRIYIQDMLWLYKRTLTMQGLISAMFIAMSILVYNNKKKNMGQTRNGIMDVYAVPLASKENCMSFSLGRFQ